MSFEAERIAIETRFKSNWDHVNTPVKFENVEYKPVPGTAFVELYVVDGDSEIVGLSTTTLHRNVGIISVRINTPLGQGTRKARELADLAAAIFRSTTFSGIICRASSITRLGEIDGWYVHVVSTPFYRDESF
jgi:hypothetical protein